MYQLYKIFHPEIFQGGNQRKPYFEGWYYKAIDKDKKHALAVIPGISVEAQDTHAFLQILDHENNTKYIRYDLKDFKYNDRYFEISIGDNYFSQKSLSLNIEENDISIHGQLKFNNIIEFPKTLLRPGIMGPFSYIPGMECYHGIISLHHEIKGQLKLSDEVIDFEDGYGYIEKDWGRSFPETWIWFQSNHFGSKDITLMFSIAKIPSFGSSFTGFLSIFRYENNIHVFATYTGAKIRKLDYDQNGIRVIAEDFRYRLEMYVLPSMGGTLKAPKNGLMDREIIESINAAVNVRFFDRKGKLIYEGTGTNTGLEITGRPFKK